MDDFLTTRQVLDILKVDRITIYRMLQDGRIKGQKIGQQWRFQRKEVDRILGGSQPSPEPDQSSTASNDFPTHCAQTIQDLFAEVGGISAMVVNTDGDPLTEISRPCRYCQFLLQSQLGQAACRASWRYIARESRAGSRIFTCHAGLQYISAPIHDNEKTIGYFLAGEFYWQPPDRNEVAGQSLKLADALNQPAETLTQAASIIPVIEAEQHSRVEAWPAAAARAVQSILHERIGFIDRLQQIATLTKM